MAACTAPSSRSRRKPRTSMPAGQAGGAGGPVEGDLHAQELARRGEAVAREQSSQLRSPASVKTASDTGLPSPFRTASAAARCSPSSSSASLRPCPRWAGCTTWSAIASAEGSRPRTCRSRRRRRPARRSPRRRCACPGAAATTPPRSPPRPCPTGRSGRCPRRGAARSRRRRRRRSPPAGRSPAAGDGGVGAHRVSRCA